MNGIRQSANIAAPITIVEVAGPLIIIGVSLLHPGAFSNVSNVIGNSFSVGALPILFGGFLAFYAFIGFEDMVNVAEEVKKPERNIRCGVFLAVFLSLGLYFMIGVMALAVIPSNVLAESSAPLADVFRVATGSDIPVIPIIGLFAIINGVLAQIIVTSRVLHGLSREKLLPVWVGTINGRTDTPATATVMMTTLMVLASLFSI